MAAVPRAGTHTESRFELKNQIKSTKNAALHFRANATPLQAKSMTYATSTRANCRMGRRSRNEPFTRRNDGNSGRPTRGSEGVPNTQPVCRPGAGSEPSDDQA